MVGEVEKSDSITKFWAVEAIFSKLDRATIIVLNIRMYEEEKWKRSGIE